MTVDVEEKGKPVIETFKNTDTILVLAITPGIYQIDYRVIKEEEPTINEGEFYLTFLKEKNPHEHMEKHTYGNL